jgi:hypothetical protein
MVVFGVVGTTVAALGVWLDRRRIRARFAGAGGRGIRIWGPFPAWGINAQLDRRRYRVSYTDRGGHSREVIVHTRIGVIAEESSGPSDARS